MRPVRGADMRTGLVSSRCGVGDSCGGGVCVCGGGEG